jgi:enoyl-CoA hydratase/carnithine racemase
LEDILLIKKSPLHWEIVLNRPEKYNAITQPMYERIIQILDQAAQDKQLVLLSITGKGKFYSAGTDLADFAKMAVSIFSNLSFHIKAVLGNSGFFRATPSELKALYEIKGGVSGLYMNKGSERNL